MSKKKETIFALSTPQGKSALAIIRISGPNSFKSISKMSSNMPKKPNQAKLNKIYGVKGDIIDETITTYFKSPESFTGEDMVEISMHGGSAVVKRFIKDYVKNNNSRMAKPGEFTRRAYENNKLDLIQAEAIADIVDAETEAQRKQAIGNLSGNYIKEFEKIFSNLKNILANIEAAIDFSDEDLPTNLVKKTKEQIKNNILILNNLLKKSKEGLGIRNGFLIAIIGKPNTGKSSFINKISDREVAIVTKEPGTTRDLIESFIDIDGYPVKFIDTAGIRRSRNKIENLGIKKTKEISEISNINLVFISKKNEIKEFNYIKKPLFVMAKQDLTKNKFRGGGFYNISSKSGFGINNILSTIKKKLNYMHLSESSFISRERHVECIKKTKLLLIDAAKPKGIDLVAEDIRLSIKELSNLFGNVDIEDILDIIFNDFCIGK